MTIKKTLLPLAVLAFLGLAVVVTFLLLPSKPPAPKPLPEPNGYLVFLAAGKAMSESSGPIPNLKDASAEQIRAYLEVNQGPLKSVRSALSLESAVPWVPTQAYAEAHIQEIGMVKKLGILLVLDGALHDLEMRPAESRRSLMEALKFARLAGNEGLVIDRLVVESVAQAALRQFRRLFPKLTADDRRAVLRDVLAWDAQDEAPSVLVERERQVMNGTLNTSSRVGFRIAETISSLRGGKSVSKQSEEGILRGIARRRLLMTQLAMAAYEADTKRPLVRLEELVPNYLPAPPVDPFSGNPLIYRRTAENTLLYSIGPDRKDDGGRPMRPPATGGDLAADAAP